ncbi:MAG: helix-turn-helix domain-containing protein [Gemmatimonadetes bacterium]|nr:helix-turn-helix domain-containing protein [Gemmatimonadota bacterium]
MNAEKRARLEAAGFTVGSVAEFLELTPEESDYIEAKLALRFFLRGVRERAGLTQAEAARRIGTSQSRLSKMEGGDPAVTLDLLVRSALKLGARYADIGKAIAEWPGAPSTRPPRAKPTRRTPARAPRRGTSSRASRRVVTGA